MHNGPGDSSAPTVGEAKVALVVNATSGGADGNAVQIFANGDPNGNWTFSSSWCGASLTITSGG